MKFYKLTYLLQIMIKSLSNWIYKVIITLKFLFLIQSVINSFFNIFKNYLL